MKNISQIVAHSLLSLEVIVVHILCSSATQWPARHLSPLEAFGKWASRFSEVEALRFRVSDDSAASMPMSTEEQDEVEEEEEEEDDDDDNDEEDCDGRRMAVQIWQWLNNLSNARLLGVSAAGGAPVVSFKEFFKHAGS